MPIFTESLRKSQTTPKKIYAIDNGLLSANTFNFSDNLGKQLKSQVYLDLRRQGRKIFYYITSGGYEVDFITQDLHGNFEILQVVWQADDLATLQREQRALAQAQQKLGFPGKILDWKDYVRQFAI